MVNGLDSFQREQMRNRNPRTPLKATTATKLGPMGTWRFAATGAHASNSNKSFMTELIPWPGLTIPPLNLKVRIWLCQPVTGNPCWHVRLYHLAKIQVKLVAWKFLRKQQPGRRLSAPTASVEETRMVEQEQRSGAGLPTSGLII